MLKRLVLFFAIVSFACTASAQRALRVAVWEDFGGTEQRSSGDNRVSALFIEYYKSELATLSRISICLSKDVEKSVLDNHKANGELTAEEIRKICKDPNVKANCFAVVRLEIGENKSNVHITVYDAQGVKKGNLKQVVVNIKDTDQAAMSMALSTAEIIRGKIPVDALTVERERLLQKNVSESKWK